MILATIALLLCYQSAREVQNPFDFKGIEKAAQQFLDGLRPDEWLAPAPLAQSVKKRRDVGNVTPPYVSFSEFQEYTTTTAFDAVATHYMDLLRKRAIATATPETFYISSQLTIQESGKLRTINWSHAAGQQDAGQRNRQTPRTVSQQGNMTIVEEGAAVRVAVNMSEMNLYPPARSKPLQDEIARAFATFLSLSYPRAVLDKTASASLMRTHTYKLPAGTAITDVLDWYQPKLMAYRLFGTLSRSERIPDRIQGEAPGTPIANMQVYVPEAYTLLVQISLSADNTLKLDLTASLPKLPPRLTPPPPAPRKTN